MALSPPDNNKGDYNFSRFAPVVWEDVESTNHKTINRSDMPFASTVEYKGYYKAEATGRHQFSLNGTEGITGYAWVSSAPRYSDHIVENDKAVKLTLQKSYGIKIPTKPYQTNSINWPWAQISGFSGYGYWPKSGYGTQGEFNNIYSGDNAPSTDCGYNQIAHQYLLPGDIRPYGIEYGEFQGEPAGPSWHGPEDPNFSAPCYPETYETPLVRIKSGLNDDYDEDVIPTTVGRTNQIFLDNSYKAEGAQNWATYEVVHTEEDHNYVWPKDVEFTQGTTRPERVQIRFYLKFSKDLEGEQPYTFEWKSRDGLKIWYALNNNDPRNLKKFPNDISGHNPCNFTAADTGNNDWLPGGGQDGFVGTINIRRNSGLLIHGYACGVPGDNTHGFSLLVRDPTGKVVFSSEDLVEDALTGLVGIDECGYNAYLDNDNRVADNRKTEFFKSDGWLGYSTDNEENSFFTADVLQGDETPRDPFTTRQYLWSNALTTTRDNRSVPGSVYLRQGDYYFVRAIVSNHLDQVSSFNFKVKSPTGKNTNVKFSGNGDPSMDTVVGGPAAGNGIAISQDKLCDSVLFQNGEAASDDTNFALITRLGVVLNLTALGVSSGEIGTEGQMERINDKNSENTASKIITLPTGIGNETVDITLTRLVRGGSEGWTDLNEDMISAVLKEYNRQLLAGLVLEFNDFRSAITSQAVIVWGTGGNYPYIYHAVSEIITSICTDTPIFVPDPPDDDTGNNSDNSDSDQIDLDITNVSGEGAVITSTAHDSCKTPDKFELLEDQYVKSQYQFTTEQFPNLDSRYYNKVKVQKDYGVVSPSKWSRPAKSGYGNYEISKISANKVNVRFEAGKVTAIPITVPDVFVPDEFNDRATNGGEYDCSYSFELSKNLFVTESGGGGSITGIKIVEAGQLLNSISPPSVSPYSTNNGENASFDVTLGSVGEVTNVNIVDGGQNYQVGDRFNVTRGAASFTQPTAGILEVTSISGASGGNQETGDNRPYLVVWVSATPGGTAIGDYQFGFERAPEDITPRCYATMSYNQFVADLKNSVSDRKFWGYVGNIYGARWFNVTTMKFSEVRALGNNLTEILENLPEAGTSAFVDMLSTNGYSCNQIKIKGTVTSPNCSTLVSDSGDTNNDVDDSFKSADDMRDFIGETDSGQVPDYVEILNTFYSLGSNDTLGPNIFTETFFWGSEGKNKRKIPWPHEGKVHSYKINARNDQIFKKIRHMFAQSGGSAGAIVSQTQSCIVIWYSATPGGEPLTSRDGQKQVFKFEQTEFSKDIYQRYSIDDPNTRDHYILIPFINKNYYINFAGVSLTTAQQCVTKFGNTINPNPRAPRKSELVEFSAGSIDNRSSLALIVISSPTMTSFEEYMQDIENE